MTNSPRDRRQIIWTPSIERASASSMGRYMGWLSAHRDRHFVTYQELWDWSISDPEGFWPSIIEFFDLKISKPTGAVLSGPEMPGAKWFEGAHLNFADQILRHADNKGDDVALICQSETFGRSDMTWADLAAKVASVAAALRDMGVVKGDRVVAILPNTETALIAFLATASLGAIWSLCAPDMGHVAVIDRFRQIEPKVLIAQDGYVHAGVRHDRRAVVDMIAAALPSLAHQIRVPVIGPLPDGARDWDAVSGAKIALTPVQVPFDHPLWVVYSSGTTGNPKPIVHGHGGIVIESAKQTLHQDLGATDRFCWMTSSGWIMWNAQWAALAQGAVVAMFDGAVNQPDMGALWRFVADERLTYFGAGAAYFSACIKAGIRPRDMVDLTNLRSLGATGSPMTADAYHWVYEAVKPDIWLAPISGGTDIAGIFVGGNPILPVREGEMQCRALGNATFAFDEDGHELIGQVGELVCTKPLPSMPLYFWGDTGNKRLMDSYYDTYPGVWRHGDWIEITEEGGAIIYGRSDATINRKGLRMGSSEIYRAVEGLPEIADSLVVDLEFLGRDSFMPLFVALAEGAVLDAALKGKINDAIKSGLSARFQPNEIISVAEIPRTLSGKKLEVPVKKLLLGGDPDAVVNRDSMANPDSFAAFIAYAKARAQP